MNRPPRRFRRFENPYFQRIQRRRRSLPVVVFSLFAVITITILTVLLVSSQWRTNGLIIEGAKPQTARLVAATVDAYLSQRTTFLRIPRRRHQWLIDAHELERRIQDAVFVESAQVTPAPGPALLVVVRERTPQLLVIFHDVVFPADRRGFILDESLTLPASGTTPLPVLRITDLQATPTPRANVASAPVQNFLDALISRINSGIAPQAATLAMERNDDPFVTETTTEGWGIKFNTMRDLDEQVTAVRSIITELKIDRSRLLYIDVRFPERVYYKER